MLIGFILGVALGVSALYAYFDSRRVLDRDQQIFLMEEVRRLRAQVANIIGRAPPTLCDAVHVEHTACVSPQAVCAQKAA